MAKGSFKLYIEGMHCAGCAANIEKKFKNSSGIIDIAINFATKLKLLMNLILFLK